MLGINLAVGGNFPISGQLKWSEIAIFNPLMLFKVFNYNFAEIEAMADRRLVIKFQGEIGLQRGGKGRPLPEILKINPRIL